MKMGKLNQRCTSRVWNGLRIVRISPNGIMYWNIQWRPIVKLKPMTKLLNDLISYTLIDKSGDLTRAL